MSIKDIRAQLEALPPDRLEELRKWFEKHNQETEKEVVVEKTTVVSMDEDEEFLSEHDENLMLAHLARERNRVQNYGPTSIFNRYAYWDKPKRHWRSRIEMRTATGLRGLLYWIVTSSLNKTDGLSKKLSAACPPVIHIQNSIKEEGYAVKLSDSLVEAFTSVGEGKQEGASPMLMVKESHLLHLGLTSALAYTFPKAVDFRAYVSGLCAPGMYIPNCEIHFIEDMSWKMEADANYHLQYVRDENGDRIPVPSEADGNGRVHPQHWLVKHLNITREGCAIQIRAWDPETGMFMKGIFVVDEEAVVDGKPAILANSSFVKGRLKGTEMPEKIEIAMTIISIWARPHKKDLSRWSFEPLQNLVVNDETKAGVDSVLRHCMTEFRVRGGMNRFVKMATREDEALANMVMFAEKAGIDPLSIKDVRNVAFTHAEKDFFTMLQGGGIKSPTFTMVLDDGIPDLVPDPDGVMRPAIAIEPELHVERGVADATTTSFKEFVASAGLNGRVTTRSLGYWRKRLSKLNPTWDGKLVKNMRLVVERLEDVYLPGDLVLVPRYPLVTQQNFCFAVVVKPLTGVLKATGRLAARTMRGSFLLIGIRNMGDADGDRTMVEGRQRILSWCKPENCIGNVHGGTDISYLLEPSKVDSAKDPKALIEVVGPEGALTNKAMHIIAREGGGPVGPLTFLHAMFMHLAVATSDEVQRRYFLCRALAIAILIQEAIDSMKRFVRYTNPVFAMDPKNWVMVSPGIYALPKEDPERFLPDNDVWYSGTGANRELQVPTISAWAYGQVEQIFGELKRKRDHSSGKPRRTWGAKSITSWRKTSTGRKRLDPRHWEVHEPVVGGHNLVTFCAMKAREIWLEEEGQELLEIPDCNILDVVRSVLEEHNFDWTPIQAPLLPNGKVDKKRDPYQHLLIKSGLLAYSKSLKKLLKLEFEHRREKAELARNELAITISLLSAQEIVSIVATVADRSTSGERDKAMNYIFRAVSMPGSPILDVLGLESRRKCDFMTKREPKEKSRAERMVVWMLSEQDRRRADGEALTLFQIALEVTGRIAVRPSIAARWGKIGLHLDLDSGEEDKAKWSKHKLAVGVPIRQCRSCVEQLDVAVRRHLMDDRKMRNRSSVTRRITVVNNAVAHIRLTSGIPEE